MENIEFKVWDKRNSCWLKGTEEPKDDNLFIEEIYENNSGIYAITNWGKLEYCLYTGLKDKVNDKKIYDKYIVKALHRNDDNEDNKEKYFRTFRVSYLNGCWMFGNRNAHEFFNKFIYIEVIGNKFEDPELYDKAVW